MSEEMEKVVVVVVVVVILERHLYAEAVEVMEVVPVVDTDEVVVRVEVAGMV